MADIELVIKINEGTYNSITDNKRPAGCVIEIIDALKNGKQLPKGHGRLIDADKLKADVGYTGYNYDFQNCLDDEPTIIEADKE